MIVNNCTVSLSSEFSILFGVEYSWYVNLSKNRNTIIISDSNIFNLYPDIFKNTNHIIIPSGEESKNFNTIYHIIDKFIENNIDRDSLVIGFGGGAICDITGFVSTIYMRGVNFAFIPSTLLAQVDASIGGKNAINYKNYKNYIGTISQPEFIICDANLLKSLPENEFKSGLGEILKYSLLFSYDLFDSLSKNLNQIEERNTDYFNQNIKDCVKNKIEIIKKDPNDIGIRHLLNFGHCFGHCFEIIDKLPHGIAVVKGMSVTLDLSIKFNYTNEIIVNKIKKTFVKLGYDINYNLTPEHFNLLKNDKKKKGNFIDFVFFKDFENIIISNTKIDDLISALS